MSGLGLPVAAQRARRLRLHPALAHHLGQGAHRHQQGALPLAARVVLVCRPKKGAQANWKGGRKASTIWEIKTNLEKSETGHSAQKPVECMQRAIHNHGGNVYDPFASGRAPPSLPASRKAASSTPSRSSLLTSM